MYNCTGNPHPADIEKIVETMMNAEFTTAHKRESRMLWWLGRRSRGTQLTASSFGNADVSELKTSKGMALADLVTGIYDCVATYKLPAQSRIFLLDHLAQIECVL